MLKGHGDGVLFVLEHSVKDLQGMEGFWEGSDAVDCEG